MDYEDHFFREAENITESFLDPSSPDDYYTVQEIILTIIGIISIAFHVLLIYIICYFRKLHTNTNIYLVNWAIADVGVLIITISFFSIISPTLDLPEALLCFYFGLACALLLTVMLFMAAVATDWCFSAFLPRPLEKFREYTKVITAVIWVLTGLYSVITTFTCSLTEYDLIFHFIAIVGFPLLLVYITLLHIIRYVKRCKGHFEYCSVSLLYIPTAFVLCWLLSWINMGFVVIPLEYYIIFELPYFFHPIINFILMVILDENFKTCFFCLINSLPCDIFKVKSQQFNEEPVNADAQVSVSNDNFQNFNRHI